MALLRRNPPPAPPRLAYSVEEFARACGIGRTTAYALISDGKVMVTRVGRRSLITAEEAQRALRALTEDPIAARPRG